MPTDTYGSSLKSLREKADMNQQELASVAQVSVSSIQNWENGRRRPRRAEFRRLATAFRMSTEELRLRLEGQIPADLPADFTMQKYAVQREDLEREIAGLREEIEYLNPKYERNRPLLVAHLERQIAELETQLNALPGGE